MRKLRGGGASEYVLPVALVALMCVAGVTLVGQDVTKYLALLRMDMGQHTANTEQSSVEMAAQTQFGTETSDMPASSVVNTLDMALGTDTAQNLDVAGANGATEALANQLSKNIPTWLAAGDISEAQANQLQALANEGHNLAELEALLETAYVHGDKEITYAGKSYPVYEFASLFGFESSRSGEGRRSGNTMADYFQFDAGSSALVFKNFAQLFQKAERSGALEKNVVRKEVTSLSVQIAAVNDALSWSITDLLMDNKLSGAQKRSALQSTLVSNYKTTVSGSAASLIQAGSASGLTSANASAICHAGGSGCP